MSASHNTSSLLTPIEGGALSKAMMDVIMARNLWPIVPELEWRCLETLYFTHLGLKKGKEELKKKIEPIIQGAKINASGYDRTSTTRNNDIRIKAYKKSHNDEFYRIIMDSLEKNNYGEIATGAAPRFEAKGHLG